MPIVSRFFGILIALYWEDHAPPHFHAKYSEDEAMIDIRSGEVIRGSMPRRALSMINEWRQLHESDLLSNWENSQKRKPLSYIDPLE
ncbi:MAG: DUF4160 domain-containing protein [Desulfamplus sp.]|nr:DUF4160 domain-containing protein [Desulfamplus sp.]